MAKDINSKKIDDLEKRIQQLKAQKSAEEAKLKKKKRADDTRKKILIGAFIMEKSEKEGTMGELVKQLDRFLVRKNDRVLFGLTEKQSPPPNPSES
ncbi:hypothetical protein JCM12296A_52530 [Desulfosarcina cetonica]|uniref:hypothetical protein n=1 Tax=Desulfosarcina cetonica TaxID=90730 RepID=UPI0006D03A36|nr:hypothetical protein [Desulfosarcina cetonica]